jgi:hypothetical protein
VDRVNYRPVSTKAQGGPKKKSSHKKHKKSQKGGEGRRDQSNSSLLLLFFLFGVFLCFLWPFSSRLLPLAALSI